MPSYPRFSPQASVIHRVLGYELTVEQQLRLLVLVHEVFAMQHEEYEQFLSKGYFSPDDAWQAQDHKLAHTARDHQRNFDLAHGQVCQTNHQGELHELQDFQARLEAGRPVLQGVVDERANRTIRRLTETSLVTLASAAEAMSRERSSR